MTQKNNKVNSKIKNILLTGGGTGGSVTPLLAVYDRLKSKNYNFCWVGTESGPEKQMVEKEGLIFFAIKSGKFRRYFSWRNFVDPFWIIFGLFQSCFILKKCKPDLVMSAGGFVSVPVIWAARIKRIPIIIHQQDARPGLANRLMSPFAKVITVTFEKSLNDFRKKSVWVGNPVRQKFIDLQERSQKELALKNFNLKQNKPVIMIVGGGTGSVFLNLLTVKSLQELTKNFQILHVTGKDKGIKAPLEWKYDLRAEDYHKFEFLNVSQMVNAYVVADIVVSRCGMAALTELSFLKKVSILVPMPRSHQEDNALIFKNEEAALVLDQNHLDSQRFVRKIKELAGDPKKQEIFKKNIENIIKKNATTEMGNIIERLVAKSKK